MKSPKTGNLPNQAAFSVRSLGQLGALTGLVYSTDTGRMCPDCRQPVEQCICKQAMPPLPTGPVRVSRETKGRGGKSVTVVRGLPLGADALAIIGKQLRAACGSGGTEKDGTLEIQGDHVEKILAFLAKVGHAAKRAG
jgi:translation initiation factor 1